MIRILVILLALLAATGCGTWSSWWARPTPPPTGSTTPAEAPPSPSALIGTPSATPKEDAAVREAHKHVIQLQSDLNAALLEEDSLKAERDTARREAEVRPVRYILVAGAGLGALAVLAGVAMWAFSLVWSFGFGGKFGLGIAAIGGAVMAVAMVFLWLIAVALAHFVAICAVLGALIAAGVAWAVWHLSHRNQVSVEQTRFSDAAAAKLKELQGLVESPDHEVDDIVTAARTAWNDVRAPAVARQVKAGIQGSIDRLRAHVAGKAPSP